jgi:hypothetical protein
VPSAAGRGRTDSPRRHRARPSTRSRAGRRTPSLRRPCGGRRSGRYRPRRPSSPPRRALPAARDAGALRIDPGRRANLGQPPSLADTVAAFVTAFLGASRCGRDRLRPTVDPSLPTICLTWALDGLGANHRPARDLPGGGTGSHHFEHPPFKRSQRAPTAPPPLSAPARSGPASAPAGSRPPPHHSADNPQQRHQRDPRLT